MRTSPQEKAEQEAYRQRLLEGIKKTYESLNYEERAVVDSKELVGTHPLAYWLQALRAITNLDKQINHYLLVFPPKNEGYKGCVTALFIFLGLGGISAFLRENYLVGFIIISVAWIGYYFSSQKWQKKEGLNFNVKTLDLPDYLVKTILPCLEILQEDINPNIPLNINVCLKTPLNKHWQKISTQKQNTENLYTYPVAQIQGTLQDKTKFYIDMQALVRERIRRKVKGDKYKLRVRLTIKTLLVFSPKKYTKNTSNAPKANAKINIKNDRYLVKTKNILPLYQTRTTTKGNKALEYFNAEEALFVRNVPQPEALLQNFMQAYSLVKPLKN